MPSELTPEGEKELREWAERFDDDYARDALAEIDRLRAELCEVKRHWAEDTRDIDEIAAALAARDAELTRLRELVPKLPEWIESYPDTLDIARCNYDCGVTIGMLKAALLPPTPKEG